MSRVEELIEELCPDGVDFRSVRELFNIRNGYTPSKSNASLWADGTIPWFRMEDIRQNGRVLDNSLQRIPEIALKGGRVFPANSLLIATSATVGEHALVTVPHLSNQRFTSLSLKSGFEQRLDMKFIFYYGFLLAEWCRKNTTKSSFASVDMSRFKEFRVPLPPLEVQQEIVRILDQFARLEEELEAELEARRIQYESYRGALTDFTADERVQTRALGDLGALFGGLTGKSKSDFGNGNARFATYKNIFQNIALDMNALDLVKVAPGERQRSLAYGDIIFTGSSESSAEVGMSSVVTERLDDPLYLNSFCIGFRPNVLDEMRPDFAKHLFRSSLMRRQIVKTASGVTRINISKARLAKIQVPVPPVEVQAEIAAVLDGFDALVNDLSIGLPAELAARRKQYEYYRDKLLTFKELPA